LRHCDGMQVDDTEVILFRVLLHHPPDVVHPDSCLDAEFRMVGYRRRLETDSRAGDS
jgi:hypothetical protein